MLGLLLKLKLRINRVALEMLALFALTSSSQLWSCGRRWCKHTTEEHFLHSNLFVRFSTVCHSNQVSISAFQFAMQCLDVHWYKAKTIPTPYLASLDRALSLLCGGGILGRVTITTGSMTLPRKIGVLTVDDREGAVAERTDEYEAITTTRVGTLVSAVAAVLQAENLVAAVALER